MDNNIRRNFIWNTFGNIYFLSCQYIIIILVVRVCGYEASGILSLSMSITTIFYSIALYNIRTFQVSDVSYKYMAADYINLRIITCIFAYLCCFIFAVANHYDYKIFFCVMIYMVLRIGEAFEDVFHGEAQRAGNMELIGKSLSLKGILFLITFFITIRFTKDIFNIILLMTCSTLIIFFFFDIPKTIAVKKINYNISLKRIRNLLIECSPLVIYIVVNNLIPTMPKYFLERFYTEEILGIYTTIATPALLVQTAISFVFSPLISIFALAFEEKQFQKFNRLFNKCILIQIIIGIFALLGGKIFGNIGLKILYGNDILNYQYLLLPAIGISILTAIVWFLNMILIVMRKFKTIGIINGIIFVISSITSYSLIKIQGMNGANWAMIISLSLESVIIFLYLTLVKRQGSKNEIL